MPFCILKEKRYVFMKLKKWLLGLVTFAAMVVICAVCAGAQTYGDFEYDVLDNGTVEITGYNGSAEKVDIPEKIGGKSVTSIGANAFEYCSSLTNVAIPNGVTRIGWGAFQYCASLTSITIPNSVTEMGGGAFYGCTSLTSITIPNGVTSIGDSAFYWCTSLTSVTIPNGVTSIGNSAFYGCTSLESITIPDSVMSIDSLAFFICTSLTSITIPDSVTSIGGSAFERCKNLTSITIPDSVTEIGSGAFGRCTSLTAINVTTRNKNYASVNGDLYNKDKTAILCYPAGKKDENYKIPDGVTSIGDYAFEGCISLTSITIPDSVTSIGWYAFYDCTSLVSITIPNSVTSISDSAFRDCSSLARVTISDSVTYIGSCAFDNCTSLMSVTIPASVTNIGDYAFGYYLDTNWKYAKVDNFKMNYVKNTWGHLYAARNGFTSESCIVIDELNDGTLRLVGYAGNNKTYVIPAEIDGKKVTRIDSYAFRDRTELTNITIPNSVTSIGWCAFYGCTGLTSITIPDSVTSIGGIAFNGCTSLTRVVIPDSVVSIGDGAFYNCTSLMSVTIPASVTFIDSDAFGYYFDEDTLESKKVDGFKINYTPNTYGHLYATKNGFSNEVCLITDERYDGTLKIDRYAGNSATYVIPAEIDGKKVTGIGANAFKGCTELTSITIPDSVTYIGNEAFYDCTSLKTVAIPASVTSIDSNAFGYYEDSDTGKAKKVDDFKINYVKNTWGHWYATKNGFSDEVCLITNELKGGTLEIDRYAGNGETYVIPDKISGKKVTVIDSYAFSDCTELTNITIPDSVTSIGKCAFEDCISLASVTISDSVISIGSSAFYNCTSLMSIAIPASAVSIDSNAFGYYYDNKTYRTKKIDGFKINYTPNTYGHLYATKNGFSDETCFATKTLDDGMLSIATIASNDKAIIVPSEIGNRKVTQIGESAFKDCTMSTSVTIPDTVVKIEKWAFENMASLAEIIVSDNNEKFTSVDGVLYNKDKTTLICYPADKNDETYTIPEGVKYIERGAFEKNTHITKLDIPDSVITICEFAFSGCTSLSDIKLPCELKCIDYGTFRGCTSLKKIELPKTLKEIGYSSFSRCTSLERIELPSDMNVIGNNAFYNCESLSYIKMPDTLKRGIGASAFSGCSSLKEIIIPGGFDILYLGVFSDCVSLEKVTIPDSIETICGGAFEKCVKLNNIVIPEGVTRIGHRAFYNCSALSNITLPNSLGVLYPNTFENTAILENQKSELKYIGKWLVSCDATTENVIVRNGTEKIANEAFRNCTMLNSVTLPSSVRFIGDSAFYGCVSLSAVSLANGVRQIGPQAFYGCSSLKSINIPDSVQIIECMAFDKTPIIDNEQSVIYLGKWLLKARGIDSVSVKNGTEYIADYAFANCDILTTVSLPDSIKSIGWFAFYNCCNLESINIPDGVNDIGSFTFSECDTIKNIILPNGIDKIGEGVFWDCLSLESVNIPSSVLSIDKYAFDNCQSLKNVSIPSSVKSLGYSAFWGCSKLENLTIPGSIKKIESRSFSGCISLKKVTLCEGIEYISEYSFSGCKELVEVSVPESVVYIARQAFSNTAIVNNQKTTVKYVGRWAVSADSATDIEISDGTVGIAELAVYNNAVKNIYIPASVRYICDSALGYSRSIRSGGKGGGDLYFSRDQSNSVIHKEFIQSVGFVEFGVRDIYPEVVCEYDSAAQQYAIDNGIGYKLLHDPHTHSYGNWIITKAATYTSTGVKTRTCTVCGKVETATIAKLTLSKVTGVKLSGRAADALRINWTKNTKADGYIVEMYQGGKWTRVAKITSNSTTTFRKAGLKAGTVYKFRVKAYKMSGKTAVYSAYSTELAARTNPSVMTGAKLGGRAADALRVNWSKNASADGYIVEMYQGNKWVRVAKIINNSTTTFRKAGLKASSVYKFRVRAYKMSGSTALYGNYSATVTAMTNPSVMAGAKLGGRAADALRINWTKNTSTDGYIVEMYQGNKWVRVAKITNSNTTTFRKAGLKASSVYKFRVSAYKMSGKTALYGNYSATVTARTNPSAVKGVKIAGKAKDALRVNWTKNTSAQGYIVEMYKGNKWVRVAKITNNSTTTFRKAGLAKNTAYKFRVRAYHMSGKTALYGNYGSVSGKTAAK